MSALLKLFSHVSLWNPRKRIAKIGSKAEPIAHQPTNLSCQLSVDDFLGSVTGMFDKTFAFQLQDLSITVIFFFHFS